MSDKAICTNCLQHVDYDVIEVPDTWECNSTIVKYVRKDAVCSRCGYFVYVEELENYNVEEPLRLYKQIKSKESEL